MRGEGAGGRGGGGKPEGRGLRHVLPHCSRGWSWRRGAVGVRSRILLSYGMAGMLEEVEGGWCVMYLAGTGGGFE